MMASKPPRANPCEPQRLFVRGDSMDNLLYDITPAAKAKIQSQEELRSLASGEPGRLRTIASSEAGGGS